MSSIKILTLASLFTVLLFTGCGSGNSNDQMLPTDVVSNPNTASGSGDATRLPAFKFEETEHDFGRIIDGETVSCTFKFKNSGKTDLVIADVSTSCGCTVPSFPKTPIRPGEEGTIKVAFNSRGKRGFQAKNVVVVANTQPNTTLLRIKAQVIAPGAE
jgi:hypothetical protein